MAVDFWQDPANVASCLNYLALKEHCGSPSLTSNRVFSDFFVRQNFGFQIGYLGSLFGQIQSQNW